MKIIKVAQRRSFCTIRQPDELCCVCVRFVNHVLTIFSFETYLRVGISLGHVKCMVRSKERSTITTARFLYCISINIYPKMIIKSTVPSGQTTTFAI